MLTWRSVRRTAQTPTHRYVRSNHSPASSGLCLVQPTRALTSKGQVADVETCQPAGSCRVSAPRSCEGPKVTVATQAAAITAPAIRRARLRGVTNACLCAA
jgi:hypothetical protein